MRDEAHGETAPGRPVTVSIPPRAVRSPGSASTSASGSGPSITVAATASGRLPEPGGVLTVAPGEVAGWRAPLPVEALHGIDPRQADTLHEYGIHTAGPLAAEEFGPGVIGPAAVRRAS